jgi:hypothetical protein
MIRAGFEGRNSNSRVTRSQAHLVDPNQRQPHQLRPIVSCFRPPGCDAFGSERPARLVIKCATG